MANVVNATNVTNEENTRNVVRNYKDSVFRMLFREKKELLVLYNAVNGTDYSDPEDLQITTLESAVYMSMKNDVSFVLDMRLSLYEHQSTVNKNMPLRDLMYVAKIFEELMTLEESVSKAVEECIQEGILREFLLMNKSKVVSMSIFEFDQELHNRTLYEEGHEDGFAKGEASGFTKGEASGFTKGEASGFTKGEASGLAKGEISGENKKLISIVCKKLKKGKTPAQIADDLEEEISLIEKICESAESFAPEYDVEKIYDAMNNK